MTRITLLAVAAAWLVAAPLAAAPRSTHQVFDIPSKAPGVSLHLEHRAPANKRCGKRAVLIVHGNFFPASTVFGLELPGGSALERLAAACVSAYTLDLRGYGGSTRPAFMSEPIGPFVAFSTPAHAQEDVGSALAFIRKREQLQRVSLLGWSWGASIMGEFASKHPEQVDKLVLYGPGWLPPQGWTAPPLGGSYRTMDRETSRERVLSGVPSARVEEIHPTEWFERFWQLNVRYDEWGSQQKPQVVRAPSGRNAAFQDPALAKKMSWDPSEVKAKTLVIVGEWDVQTPVDGAKAVHEHLTKAAARELTILPEATHFAILEKHRGALLDALSRFLGDKPGALANSH